MKKHELRVPGQVQAVRTQKIDIPEGTVQNMTVKNGDSVTLDQQLLTVYKPDVQAKLMKLHVRLKNNNAVKPHLISKSAKSKLL